MKRIKNNKQQYSKCDIRRINHAFYKKVEDYSKLTLDELKELFPTLGGTYRIACLHVTEEKLKEVRDTNLKEAIEQNKEDLEVKPKEEDNNDIKEETTGN